MSYVLNSLNVGYGTTTIASNINASLREGELCCLLGPNGAGKSTLLRTLCGFQPPLGGEMLLDNRKVTQIEPREFSRLLGVVLTNRVSIPGMSVRDIVAMGRAPYTNYWGTLTAQDNDIIDDALQLCGIEALAKRESTTLSDGEHQKAMIAKAIAQQTPIILLDEPTAFLDFPSKVDTMLLLSNLAHQHGKSILISTHDLDLALQTSDSLWLMGVFNNTIINDKSKTKRQPETRFLTGTPHSLAQNGSIQSLFATPNISFSPTDLRFTISKK